MIGLACSAIAFGSAWLVARREPGHRHVSNALFYAATYAGCVEISRHVEHADPVATSRSLLLLWAFAAIASGWAYLRAWQWNAGHAFGLLITCFLLWCLGAGSVRAWTLATWGPFAASSLVGCEALWTWWRGESAIQKRRYTYARVTVRPTNWTFTQRIALILLVSDVCMLAFVPWPGVQQWQGRVSALVVAAFQCVWLIKRRY